jgi:voltage-gated potassium channel Kch
MLTYHMFEGILLILVTVFIHATGTIFFLRIMAAYRPFWEKRGGLLLNTLSLTWVIATLVALHILEIAVYAFFYYWEGILPNLETAGYFSISTYTTVGYGDVVLSREWRTFGASEALVGILMTAWSTGLLIAVVNAFQSKTIERWRTKPLDKNPEA